MTVYIIQCGETPFVKIGWAVNIKQRLKTLQSAHYEVLHVIHSVPGCAHTEEQFHTKFRRYHHRNEWYRFCDEMLTFEPEPEPVPVEDRLVNREVLRLRIPSL